MKKRFLEYKFKTFNLKRSKRKKREKKYIPNPYHLSSKIYEKIHIFQTLKGKEKLKTPDDFRFIDNTEECLSFIQSLRSENYIINVEKKKYIILDFSNVRQIDYAIISVLKALIEELSSKKIAVCGNFPEDNICKNYLAESGFLNSMTDFKGKKYKKNHESEIMLFEQGKNTLSQQENAKLGEKIKWIRKHLTNEEKHFNPLKTIILEICGNSIEHNDEDNKKWYFGVKFQDDKVICTATDIGYGILNTLKRDLKSGFIDFLGSRNEIEFLQGAFIQKYGSQTREQNRNKGLPAIKKAYEKGYISNLLVITNNVILHFDDQKKSIIFKNNKQFTGTFYQWEINKNSFSTKNSYE